MALSCPSPRMNSLYLKSLCSFVNVLCLGDSPADVVPYLCSASLTTLKKKSGGLHSVAVGKVLRKLVSKCISLSVSSQAAAVDPNKELTWHAID